MIYVCYNNFMLHRKNGKDRYMRNDSMFNLVTSKSLREIFDDTVTHLKKGVSSMYVA